MSEQDPRFYNPDGKPVTLTDHIEFIQMLRTLGLDGTNLTKESKDV